MTSKRHIAATIAAALLSEGIDDTGCLKLNKIQAFAFDLGATSFNCEEGVGFVVIKGPEAAQELLQLLDDEDCVEAYDVEIDGEAIEGESDDVLAYPEDTVFGITFYLNEDAVTYAGVEVEDVESELQEAMSHVPVDDAPPLPSPLDESGVPLDEVARKIRVNFRGKKSVKMQCPKGFKYSPSDHACVKIAGDQLAQNRKASIKAVRTRKAGGAALKARAAIRTKKAMKFRKALGL